MASTEKLLLIEAPGTINRQNELTIASPYVVGVRLGNKKTIYHHQFLSINNITHTTVELPTLNAQRLYELFKKLYSPGRLNIRYDGLSGLDFITGAVATIRLRKRHYFTGDPVDPRKLEAGEPYIVMAGDTACHGMLATDKTRALHVSGPQGGLGHTPVTDILKMWEGQLYPVITTLPI